MKQPLQQSTDDGLAMTKLFTYSLQVLRGIAFPLLKITYIAMASKLLNESLRLSLPPELYQQIDDEIFSLRNGSTTTKLFLMHDLGFLGTLGVSIGLVLLLAILQPLSSSRFRYHLNFREVKRLQSVLYDRLIMPPESNTVTEATTLPQATDLLYTKMNVIENYVRTSQYIQAGDKASILTGLVLLLTLSWDLGLITLVAAALIFVGCEVLRTRLSTPYAQQRETKVKATNELLLDLIVCREVVLTNAKEHDEQQLLREHLEADQGDAGPLFRANFVSEVVKVGTFYCLTPLLFLFVFLVDPTLQRVFQLLLIVVITDELLSAYLAYSNHLQKQEEYSRAKQEFCRVLNMDEAELFPPDFAWPTFWGKQEQKHSGSITQEDGHNNNKIFKDTNTDLAPLPQTADFETTGEDSFLGDEDDIEKQSGNKAIASASFLGTGATIELNNLSLAYTSRGTAFNVFDSGDGLNMAFESQRHYAVMGETGAGKSSILRALAGLIPPLHGNISVHGKTVDTRGLSWRQQVNVVSQNPVFFNRTIRENLCYGCPSSQNDDQIWEVLDKVNLRQRIEELPLDLDTCLQENGLEFSGGQRQRLAIARLLLRGSQAGVVLLDEPTSAQDSMTTKKVLGVLKEFVTDKTLIMVTHDVQPLVLTDTVYTLRGGGVECKEMPADQELR